MIENWMNSSVRVLVAISEQILVDCGVPHGSVLGPVLFDLGEGADASSANSVTTQSWEEWLS